MANHAAAALVLRDGDGEELRVWVRSTSVRVGLVRRARIVLLAAEGVANARIAEVVGTSTVSVVKWRRRYEVAGLQGLMDAPRSGRPQRVDQERIIAATLSAPPSRLGVTHWSSRLLAAHLGIGNATVARVWRRWGVQPWRQEGFKFSTDPELVGKVTDVVGLYLKPPENAIVLCVDEKSQIQALDRTAPMLPMRPGDVEKRTHDYTRHGTTTLFAALEVATGHVTGACKPKHRRQEFFQIRSLGGAIFVLSLMFSPYVYWIVSLNFARLPANQVQAARLLGAGEGRIFRTVVLPLARPAIAVACTLVAMETLADFGTVAYFSV